ncbi:hypothetical protein [Paenibacillus sp. YAF4_2]|uniref:hypothetical protein n=1 Tax=Paenibacillus sp. YAF4_2 TaxID=3233085 RepID=UPI003F9DCEEA
MTQKLVYYSQKDKRWSNLPFTITGNKKQTIGTRACGPTAFAMAASYFLGRAVLPTEAAKFALDKGYGNDCLIKRGIKNDGRISVHFSVLKKKLGNIGS